MINYYLSNKYIRKIKDIENEAWETKSMEKIDSIQRCCDLLTKGFRINTDMEIMDLERIVSDSNTGIYNSEADRVLISAFRNDTIHPCDFANLQNLPHNIYLADNDVNQPYDQGVISSINPIEFSKNLKSWSSSILGIKKNDNYTNITFPPSNALILIDPYLIESKKIDKLIEFVGNLRSNKLSPKFHLTIFSNISYGKDAAVLNFKNTLDQLINLEYEIILVNKIFTDNRVFISNYNFGSFSHPFDRDDVLAVSFVPTEIKAMQTYLTAEYYVNQLVKQTKYFSMTESMVQKIYKNNPAFSNRLIHAFCPN